MNRIIIFGNSGSGKSTLAKKLVNQHGVNHLDMDTLAWLQTEPPQRAPLNVSTDKIDDFIDANQTWVIEGCYTDLLTHAAQFADQAIFMNLSVEQCQINAKSRPWESHKYESKAAQDENLPMLLDWISAYETRNDEFSYQAHIGLYNAFSTNKKQIINNR